MGGKYKPDGDPPQKNTTVYYAGQLFTEFMLRNRESVYFTESIDCLFKKELDPFMVGAYFRGSEES